MAKSSSLAAGSLRHLVVIEEPYAVAGGRANEQLTAWRQWRCANAAVRNAPGREYLQQGAGSGGGTGQVRAEQVLRFTCRYNDVEGVSYGMRIIFQAQAFDITDIRPDFDGMAQTVIDARLVQ